MHCCDVHDRVAQPHCTFNLEHDGCHMKAPITKSTKGVMHTYYGLIDHGNTQLNGAYTAMHVQFTQTISPFFRAMIHVS